MKNSDFRILLLVVAFLTIIAAGLLTDFQRLEAAARPFEFTSTIYQIPVSALHYDSRSGRIIVAVDGSVRAPLGNSLTFIDPESGNIEESVFVGSNPSQIVPSPDGRTVWVGLAGSASLLRFDLASRTALDKFYLGNDALTGPLHPNRVVVSPTDPDLIAVVPTLNAFTAGTGAVRVYRNGVVLPRTVNEVPAPANDIAFSSDGSKLLTTGNRLTAFDITADGPESPGDLGFGIGNAMKSSGGRLYASSGMVADEVSGKIVGRFALPDLGYDVLPDPANGRVYFFDDYDSGATVTIGAYDINTFAKIGAITVPYPHIGIPRGLSRWGVNGLAFTNGTNACVIRTTLVSELAAVTPIPSVTTEEPPPPSTLVRRVPMQANDFVFSPSQNAIFAAVSPTDDSRANTITRINPVTGMIGDSVPFGVNPDQMAISDDGRSLYVRRADDFLIGRLDSLTGNVGNSFWTPQIQANMAMHVNRGSPGTIVVYNPNYGLAVFDNGIQRGDPTGRDFSSAGWSSLVQSDIPNIYYNALNPEGVGSIISYRLDANGPVVTDRFPIGTVGASTTYGEGRVYLSGRVFNPAAKQLEGTFSGCGGAVTVDTDNRRLICLTSGFARVYDIETFTPVGEIDLQGISWPATRIVRWGENGFAYRYNIPAYPNLAGIYLVQSNLINPNSKVPVGVDASVPANVPESVGAVTMTITRSGGLSLPLTVGYETVDDTATAGSDYQTVTGTVSFAAGETARTVTIPIVQDNILEGSERFFVRIRNVNGGVLLNGDTFPVTITDDEPPRFLFAVPPDANEPPPNGFADVDVTVRLSGPTIQPVSVSYATVAGTAIPGVHFQHVSGILEFAPLETEKNVRVRLFGDRFGNLDARTFSFGLAGATNATIPTTSIAIPINPYLLRNRPRADFDSDGSTDLALFRPSTGEWWSRGTRPDSAVRVLTFGTGGDVPLAADFTGDGVADNAIYRPSTGEWFVQRSEDLSYYSFRFGTDGDVPVAADFDGDQISDPTVFRPSTGHWFVFGSTAGVFWKVLGAGGDVPIPEYFDWDPFADLAVFRPSTGEWIIAGSVPGSETRTFQFGGAGDVPLPGRYGLPAVTDLGIFRPSAGQWLTRTIYSPTVSILNFGTQGDIAAPGDYNGDGIVDFAVFRPSTGHWYIKYSGAGFANFQFGASGDVPVGTFSPALP